MAKKHSSKTATEKALSDANPRIQVFNKWAGVNFKDSPLGWEYGEEKFYAHHQTDLPLNNWLIQNNMVVDMSDSVSTRSDAEILVYAPNGWKFTGVSCLWRNYLLMVVEAGENHQSVVWYDLLQSGERDPHFIECHYRFAGQRATALFEPARIYEIGYYENTFIALVSVSSADKTIALTMPTPDNDEFDPEPEHPYSFYSEAALGDPSRAFNALVFGMDWIAGSQYEYATDEEKEKCKVRYTFVYTIENKWGSTLISPPVTVWTEEDPYGMSSEKYVFLRNMTPDGPIMVPGGGFWVDDGNGGEIHLRNEDFTGIDIWVNQDENQDYVLIAHIEFSDNFYVDPTHEVFNYKWFGSLTNTDAYSNAPLRLPQENTTYGPEARHFTTIDSRFYWWGDPQKPWRLLIGGNVGNELSTSRSVGGGWIDIEPGSGYEISNCLKWKTAQGANIVTIFTGGVNSTREKRFNLVELTANFTNEDGAKGWQYEEVSNVVGCSSRWGSDVFGDGLYCISRYGLMLTTMTAEYNNQMKNQKVSEVIDPIFTERLGTRLDDARLVHIDGVVYIILSEETSESEPQNLDKVILCYDLDKKAWFTFTPGHDGDSSSTFLHAMAIDYKGSWEGLGIITENAVTLYPTTGIQETTRLKPGTDTHEANIPKFDILLESGELCSRVPMQAPYYVEQLEFRFDYFMGNCELEIEGVDYYGRKFKIEKHLGVENDSPRSHDFVKRDYVEWVRVQKLVEFFRIKIKGPCRCRLTHIINKAYLYNNLIGMPYGFDAKDTFINRHGDTESIHHYVSDYNNLRRAIVT